MVELSNYKIPKILKCAFLKKNNKFSKAIYEDTPFLFFMFFQPLLPQDLIVRKQKLLIFRTFALKTDTKKSEKNENKKVCCS